MTTLTRNFNTDDNFWETNPSFKTIKLFRELYEDDSSRSSKKSSQLMWAIALLVDPHQDNPWRNLSEDDKKMLIADEYLNESDFDWSKYQIYIDEYYMRALTLAEKDFQELIEKMHERKEFIKDTPYTLDTYEADPSTGKYRVVKGTAKDLDKMIVDTVKLYEQLEVVKQKLEKEKQIDGETKGGREESATEKGLL